MKTKIYFLLLLMFSFTVAMSQNKTVTGTVTSDSGEPLPGATINLKGTKTNTTTNMLATIPYQYRQQVNLFWYTVMWAAKTKK